MPLVYRSQFLEGGQLIGIISQDGLVFAPDSIGEIDRYVGYVTRNGSIFLGGFQGEDGRYVGYVKGGGVYQGGFAGEGGRIVGKLFTTYYYEYTYIIRTVRSILDEGRPIAYLTGMVVDYNAELLFSTAPVTPATAASASNIQIYSSKGGRARLHPVPARHTPR